MRTILVGLALAGAALFGVLLNPASSVSNERAKMTVTLAGKMSEGPDWVDTKILCDSHDNEIVVVKNREQGLRGSDMQMGVVAIPGGCR
ncbi:MAG: hypothetical protein E6H00_07175 [Bacillati bacterium ANGP1]|uniref:Uncharacterized protein n=1 Tax=Candidatus Segetimicrobium genomatis TaxID=2569760 RepID=A0A537K346_9BACT|nr:MAG: hypothetical protein E6H00_07175 [Terrabacteria group bacterium ANGP1]